MSRLPKKLRTVLSTFKAESDQRRQTYAAEHIVQGPLYHYTTPHGARSILSGNALWFFDYLSLQDAKEVAHGLEAAVAGIEALQPAGNEIIELFVNALRATVRAYPSDLGYFIASFCPEPDDANLWRLYGADGTGCAIGFSNAHFAITEPTGDVSRDVNLIKMRYDANELHQRQSTAIQSALKALKHADLARFAPPHPWEFFLQLGPALINELFLTAALYKQPNYVGERETRLAYVRDIEVLKPHLCVLDSGRRYIPYSCNPSLAGGGLDSIWLGPQASAETVAFVRQFVSDANLSESIIKRSQLSFRPRR